MRFAAVELPESLVIVIAWAVELYSIRSVPSGLLVAEAAAGFVIPVILNAPDGPVILAKDFFGIPILLLAPFDKVKAPTGSWRILAATPSKVMGARESITPKNCSKLFTKE
tara:strand:+ start:354 stop:686 length:333 start_codon:yes stop_codon:yes gene_type:complete